MGKYASIDEYISDQEDDKANIVSMLVEIVKEAAPGAQSAIKWSQPVFSNEQGPFCFIKAHKNHVNIGFWRGVQMKDQNGVLEGTGEKMRHIKIYEIEQINKGILAGLIKQGLELNEEFGDPSR